MTGRTLAAFAHRMAEICNDLRLPPGRGRVSALARTFGVTPNAAKKWIEGIGMPELEKAIEIADRASVNVTWLLQGAGPKHKAAEGSIASAIVHAVSALQTPEGIEVADFVRYKIERADPSILANEEKANYIKELDDVVFSRRST